MSTPRVLSSVTPADKVRPFPLYKALADHRAKAIAELIDSILAFGDGGTFGFARGNPHYVVGGYADSLVIKREATPAQIKASVLAYASDKPIQGDSGLGYWRDEDTSRIWLDSVRGFNSHELAWHAAHGNGELAFWDLQEGQEIRLVSSRNPSPWYGQENGS